MRELGSRAELIRALAVLAEPPGPEHARLAEAVGLAPQPASTRYSELFLFQLYPYASVHLGPEGMLGGAAHDRVAGFWRALGQTPPAEPDHLSALLGLYATLAEGAAACTGSAEATLIERGQAALLHEHLAPWVPFFLDRVRQLGGDFYAAWAALLDDVLTEEMRAAAAPTELPAHLREAPKLPDPRRRGAGAFLSGVLAPARSGMIVTRDDLATLGRSLRLGLRIGERRYVLEHLISQEPVAVLLGLRDHAEARAERYGALHPVFGPVSTFWTERARATAELLGELAADGSSDAALLSLEARG